MTTLSTTEAHEKFSELLRRVAADKERIILTRAGEELVAVVPIEDLALVEALEDHADIEEARQALREIRKKGRTRLADLAAYWSAPGDREQAMKKRKDRHEPDALVETGRERQEIEMRLTQAYAGEADTLLEEVEELMDTQAWLND